MARGDGKSVTIGSLRLSFELVEAIDGLARREGRSRTAQIRKMLETGVGTVRAVESPRRTEPEEVREPTYEKDEWSQ